MSELVSDFSIKVDINGEILRIISIQLELCE